MCFRGAVILILFLSPTVKAEYQCASLAQEIASLGLQKEEISQFISAEDLIQKTDFDGYESCDLIVACSQVEHEAQCRQGVRQFFDQSIRKVENGNKPRAEILGALAQHTDGEITVGILASLSYFLPKDRQYLSDLISRKPHLNRWARAIVDPAPDLREIDNRCAYFEDILSEITGSSSSEVDTEIDHWAKESLSLYQCHQ